MKTNGMKKVLSLLISGAITAGVMSPLSAFAAGNGVTITTAENGGRLSVKAALTSDDAVTGTAIAAVYNEDNELLAVQTKEAAANVSFTFDRNEDAKNTKVMWWDNLTSMTPQANADIESIVYLKLLPADGTVTAAFENKASIALTGLPEDIENPKAQVYYTTGGRNATYTYLTPLVVDETDDDIDPTTVNITNGKIAIEEGSVTNTAGTTQTYGTPVDGTTYTIAVSSDNYAPFKVTAEYTVTITGYTPIADVEADYVSQAASFYNLPKTVTFNLSDGDSFEVKVMSWAFTENSTLAPKGTATAKAILDNPPSGYSKYAEALENANVTATVKFNESEETDEIKVVWEAGHVTTGYSSDTVTYPFDENPKAAIINYDGDGSDITLTTGYPTYLSLSVGNGLTYDSATNTLTILTDKFLESGFKSSTYSTLKIGDSKTVNFSMAYTTDRSVAFEKATSGYSGYSYSNTSRKQPLTDTVTFTNVPDEDIEAAWVTFSDSTAATGVTLTPTEEDGVYTLTVPYEAVSEHIASGWNGDYVSLTLNVRGMAAASITVNYMAAPKLTLDSSKGYYATENPVVTLANFTASDLSDVEVSWSYKDSETKTTLTKDTDYTISEDNKITLTSASILGGTTLSEEKTITLYVAATEDEEEAHIDIRYKKDRTLEVADVTDLSPYSAASAQLSGSEEGYTGLEVYYGETKIANTTVSSTGTYGDYTYFVTIPYASISEYLVNNSVTLTAKLTGCAATDFTVTYAEVTNDGDSVPVDTTRLWKSYDTEVTETQDGMPKTNAGSFYLLITGDDVTEAYWKNMGVTIKKKDASADTEISLGVQGVSTLYDSNWSQIGKGVQLGSVSKEYSDNLFPDDTTEGAFTITLYKAGFAKTEINVYLTKPTWW